MNAALDTDLRPAQDADDAPAAPASAPAAPGARTGPELIKATKPYAEERPLRTWWELGHTAVVFAGVLGLALAAPWLWLKLIGSVLVALVTVRLFIIYHDAMHGAIFRKSRAGNALMWLVGLWTLSPPNVWRETHDYHHKNNCKLPGTAIGSYPVVTTRMWRRMSAAERRTYAMARHPLFIGLGYFTIFLAGMITAAFVRRPKEHWPNLVAVVFHFGLAALAGWAFGWVSALTGVILPLIIACALGSYLFYAQHNYPDAVFSDRQRWTYTGAALDASSMFDMSPVMHWFTGNIGYHHVHHLNHRIPFYRLREAMRAIPELQQPGRTTWHPRDVAACLRLKLWDPSKKRMVGWAEATLG